VEPGDELDLIDVAEAAEILKVDPSTIYRAIADGRLQGYDRPFDGRQQVSRRQVERVARYRPMRRRKRRDNDASGAG
jgi:excisionase family DNA binding protein